jgi:uncharacterized protein
MATIAVVPEIESSSPKLVAPRWHTVLFVALFLALAFGGALFQRDARSQPGRLMQHPHVVPLYLSLIAMEWGLFFRGYFQRQFEVFTRSIWIALFLQSALFAISHGYQGLEACVKIAILGALYGLFALWRGRLRPGMIAHGGSDILSGIFRI